MKESLATLWQRMVYVLAYIGALVLFLIVISVVVAISQSIKRPRSIPLSRQVPAFVVIVTDTSVPPTDIPPTVLSMVTPVPAYRPPCQRRLAHLFRLHRHHCLRIHRQ